MSLFGGRFQGTNIAKMEQLTKNQCSQLPWEGWDLVPEDLASEKFTANGKNTNKYIFRMGGSTTNKTLCVQGVVGQL